LLSLGNSRKRRYNINNITIIFYSLTSHDSLDTFIYCQKDLAFFISLSCLSCVSSDVHSHSRNKRKQWCRTKPQRRRFLLFRFLPDFQRKVILILGRRHSSSSVSTRILWSILTVKTLLQWRMRDHLKHPSSLFEIACITRRETFCLFTNRHDTQERERLTKEIQIHSWSSFSSFFFTLIIPNDSFSYFLFHFYPHFPLFLILCFDSFVILLT
jgi:hypothetical protein